jgi:hypothetical protein
VWGQRKGLAPGDGSALTSRPVSAADCDRGGVVEGKEGQSIGVYSPGRMQIRRRWRRRFRQRRRASWSTGSGTAMRRSPAQVHISECG